MVFQILELTQGLAFYLASPHRGQYRIGKQLVQLFFLPVQNQFQTVLHIMFGDGQPLPIQCQVPLLLFSCFVFFFFVSSSSPTSFLPVLLLAASLGNEPVARESAGSPAPTASAADIHSFSPRTATISRASRKANRFSVTSGKLHSSYLFP